MRSGGHPWQLRDRPSTEIVSAGARRSEPRYDLQITPIIARHGTEHGSGLGVHRWVVEGAIALLHWWRNSLDAQPDCLVC